MLKTTHKRIRVGARPGFTLAEVLVVIAIITTLVAIVVPVTVQARNRSRTVACVSNLRQLGQAVFGYIEDFGGTLPKFSGTAFAGSVRTTDWPDGSSATELRELLAGRVRNDGVYSCANDFGAPEFGYADNVFSHAGSSYVPWTTARAGRYGVSVNGARLSALFPASSLVLLRDYGSEWHGYHRRNGMSLESTALANSLFADGHAAAVRAYSVAVSQRHYVCIVTSSGLVMVGGGSGDVRADLTGRSSISNSQLDLRLSGTVSWADTSQDVDRVFTLGPGVDLESAFRQVACWVDSLAAQ